MDPDWLKWAKQLQALSQTGLHYSDSVYDLDRYKEIQNIAAEILSAYGRVDKEYVLNLFSKETGYATPKVDVRGVVFMDSKILLVREILDNHKWTLPGGWADVNELFTFFDIAHTNLAKEVYKQIFKVDENEIGFRFLTNLKLNIF